MLKEMCKSPALYEDAFCLGGEVLGQRLSLELTPDCTGSSIVGIFRRLVLASSLEGAEYNQVCEGWR